MQFSSSSNLIAAVGNVSVTYGLDEERVKAMLMEQKEQLFRKMRNFGFAADADDRERRLLEKQLQDISAKLADIQESYKNEILSRKKLEKMFIKSLQKMQLPVAQIERVRDCLRNGDIEGARLQIEDGYESKRIAPEQQGQLMEIISKLLDQNQLLAGNQSKSLDIIKQLGGANMGDTYNINGGQIGVIGQHASASGNTFQQITVADLSRLHEAMRNAAATPAQNAAADEVAKAEQAAKQQDEPKMRQHLKNAGKFAVDCVQKIGAKALSEYLKKVTLGM